MKAIGHDIGKGLSIWLRFMRSEDEAHEDVDRFHAPSECHALVSKGIEKRLRVLRRHIKATTGLKYRVFERECRRRTSPSAMYRIGF